LGRSKRPSGAWLRQYEVEWDAFEYNVRVGSGLPFSESVAKMPGGPGEAYRKMWRELTQLRIDAVGIKGTSATLFEVKDRAAAGVMGQLLAYFELFQELRRGFSDVDLGCVCRSAQPDLRALFVSQGFALFVMGDDVVDWPPDQPRPQGDV
jgi:hypothetical protein